MANNYFQFKKFIVYQNDEVMKVTTDACLFGALVASTIEINSEINILDIGTGIGLLSLMVAQKIHLAKIDAIELDKKAFNQAKINFDESPFASQINLHHQDVQNWQPDKKYLLIICNPPFFKNDLQSDKTSVNNTRHESELSPEKLLHFTKEHLSENGAAWFLYPDYRKLEIEQKIIDNGLFIQSVYNIYQTENHSNPFRQIWEIGKTFKENYPKRKITIKTENEYSEDFRNLLEPYYLNF